MRYEFIESPVFSSYLPDYLTDEEYAGLQEYLCEQPEAGDLVRGSGGVRKLRWHRSGTGNPEEYEFAPMLEHGPDRYSCC